ncbi:DUF4268 domain-containing protein [Methanococcoides sp. LMO-2]|uniref:DUF4268 domain-containing protein n=1 Tax=Methanococcoides cohabitans TaxID=3136559 RepID=A0ABU9KVL0_9EURY
MDIGKIEKVGIKDMWKREDSDFTPWLAKNLEILGREIEMELSFVQKEKRCGSFSLDILAKDENDNNVVIENQYGKSDHDHLGKLLTYLTGLDAKTAIWICEDGDEQHIQVIEWLNNNTPDDILFYLVKLEGLQIGNSMPAPHFSLIRAPSKTQKAFARAREEDVERYQLRREFWKELIQKSSSTMFGDKTPSKNNWIRASAGKSGLSYTYSITMNSASVELTIDNGKDSEELNKQRFDELHNNKNSIENIFMKPLDWNSVEGRKAYRIKWTTTKAGLKDRDKWDNLQAEMIHAMGRLEMALSNNIQNLRA